MRPILILATFFLGITQFVSAQSLMGSVLHGQNIGDYTGWSVSMPDSFVVAVGSNSASGVHVQGGQVQIFKWHANNWVLQGNTIHAEAPHDFFGTSVSMPNASTIASGAPKNDGNGGVNSGHVRVFDWNGIDWIQRGLDLDGLNPDDNFGYSVSMPDTNTIAIGAPANDSTGIDAGMVGVFNWNGASWIQKGDFILGDSSLDQSGFSISMPDSNTIAIGSPYSVGGNGAGKVRIFTWSGNNWIMKGQSIYGESAGDRSGYSVSMPDADHIAIGAPYNFIFNGPYGHTRVYKWNGIAWVQLGQDIDGEYIHDQSGCSVSMPDSNTLAIGALANSAGILTTQGHIRVFRYINSSWQQEGDDIDGIGLGANFGLSVSMSNQYTVAGGAPALDTNRGYAAIYRLCDSNQVTSSVDSITACAPFIWINDSIYCHDNNSAIHHMSNSRGCDSLVHLVLDILEVDTGISRNGAMLTANATNAQYQWLDCDSNYSPIPNATNKSFQPTKNGTYAIEVTENDCTDTSKCIIVNNVGQIELRNLDITVFPNPVSNFLKIYFHQSPNSGLMYRLVSPNGVIIQSGEVESSEALLSLSEYPEGLYLLIFTNGNEILGVKRIKKSHRNDG